MYENNDIAISCNFATTHGQRGNDLCDLKVIYTVYNIRGGCINLHCIYIDRILTSYKKITISSYGKKRLCEAARLAYFL